MAEQLSVQEAIARDHVELGTQMFFAITDVPDDEWKNVHVEVGPPAWAEEQGWCFEYHPPQAGFIQLPGETIYKPAIYGGQANGVVNLGLQMALDLLSGVTAPHILQWIGIASDTTAVTATTVHLGGAAAVIQSGASQNGFLRAFSPAASRSGQVLTAGATFTQADMAGALFVIHKVGLGNDTPATGDAGTGLGAGPAVGVFDVIGGTGGSAPFNQPFTIDLTGVTTWSLLMQIQVTAANA